MAKRNRRGSTLNATAQGIGAALGRVAARVEALRHQRQVVADEIRQVLEAAQEMLAELGDEAIVARRRAGRRASKVIKAAGRRTRMISAEGRERIAAAQRRRWAKYKKAKAKKEAAS